MQRDARHEAIVQMLLDRDVEDREAREKRQLSYRQYLENNPEADSGVCVPGSPVRLHNFRTKVPCRITPAGRALLDQLTRQFDGSVVSVSRLSCGRQALMLSAPHTIQPIQIGLVEQCAQSDAALCNVRDQGLSVETDDGTTLMLRFYYPATSVQMCSRSHNAIDHVGFIDFAEIRAALNVGTSADLSPRLVWVTRPETETMNDVSSRDYESFYIRFKLEVQSGVWHTLSASIARSPRSQWHRGSYYAVVHEPDAMNGRIYQRTLNDNGSPVNIGLDRMYDATAATDMLLLYLGGDVLADFVDIYFTLQNLSVNEAYALKEEFFALIRQFWGSTASLEWCYGNEQATVSRISQRVLPTPAQASLLRQDWINLRQRLIDQYGEGGRHAAGKVVQEIEHPRSPTDTWAFDTFPVGEINLGLRLVYRQEWRLPSARLNDRAAHLDAIVMEARQAAVKTMNWHIEAGSSINIGMRALAARSDLGVETECRESSRITTARLSEIMQGMTGMVRDAEGCDVTTYATGLQNVVMVAEELPTASEIDRSWVKRHDWILAKVLLDESFRPALSSISLEARAANATPAMTDLNIPRDGIIEVDTSSGIATVHADGMGMAMECLRVQRDLELDAMRNRLYEHIRANILHYQRAIWLQEDAQQRVMRYKKSGKQVPADWRFELTSGDVTIGELNDLLSAPNVDGQFAAYSDGRQVRIDELIDASAPIGYYGNYAVYQMRPEFGSDGMFSMLHFFKSPYLRAGGGGNVEVVDPLQMQVEANFSIDPCGEITHDVPRFGEGYELILAPGIAMIGTNRQQAPGQFAITARNDAVLTSLSSAAAAPRHEPLIITNRDGGATRKLVAGVGAAEGPEPVLHARSNDRLRPNLVAG